ncbi:MAG: type III-A CRISPR-associated RAMP protein Csm3 [Candidatus Auribacterota bacterium]|jgi:CRISPR-associated protein Csm3
MSGFVKKLFLRGTIETITGLHISAYNEMFSLGVVDYTVMRDPVTQNPFIPGSSIKGKLRALLDNCCVDDNQKELIGELFGKPSKYTKNQPARLIFRDAFLTDESLKADLPFADLPFTELKKELSIDRKTGKASPTLVERVAPGLSFSLSLILTLFENDPEDKFISLIFTGLGLLQDDYLGGRGSRGYGEIKVHLQTITQKTRDSYLASGEQDDAGIPIPENLK